MEDNAAGIPAAVVLIFDNFNLLLSGGVRAVTFSRISLTGNLPR
jgi:hypothetical protein